MGRKWGRNGNYNKDNKETVYRLPHHGVKEKEERERWNKSIPRENFPDKSDTSFCARHWPPNVFLSFSIIVYGRRGPKHPPSVFDCVNPSQVPTGPSKPRYTTRALSSVRATIPDELSSFLERDKIVSIEDLREKISSKFRLLTIQAPIALLYKVLNLDLEYHVRFKNKNWS